MDEVAATEDAIRALTVKKEVIGTRRVFTSDAVSEIQERSSVPDCSDCYSHSF